MPNRNAADDAEARERWVERVAALDAASQPARVPLSTDRILETALDLVASDGFDALTMRGLAAALGASPGALYAHVRDKADLDDLMIGRLCSRVVIPAPDAARWRTQALNLLTQLRDQYLRYPGIARVVLTAAPHSPDTLRVMEGLLEILLAGGVPLRPAVWGADAAFGYLGAYTVVAQRRRIDADPDAQEAEIAEVIERFTMLPRDRFPVLVEHAEEMVSGAGHARFDFTVGLLIDGLPTAPEG